MSAQDSLPDRYGHAPRRRPHRRRWWAVTGIALLIIAVTAVAFRPRTQPSSENVAYQVHDSAQTTVRLNVVPDQQRTVRCAVKAVNQYEATVGYKEVTIAPDSSASAADAVHLRVNVATTQRAATGSIDRCWFAD